MDIEKLIARAKDAGAGSPLTPEVVKGIESLSERVTQLEQALGRYASKGEWALGDKGTCYVGRKVAAKALGSE